MGSRTTLPDARRASSLRRAVALATALVLAVISGCGAATSGIAANGSCAAADLPCASPLVAYACTGSARPDQSPTVTPQKIEGLVCTAQGELESGESGYCCTSSTTSCGFDPTASCPSGVSGYSCLGTNRPDAYDATLSCGQGLRVSGFTTYCCGPAREDACAKNDNVTCPQGVSGFKCTGAAFPNQGDIGLDQSRSDAPLLCSIRAELDATRSGYCCYTPTFPPLGATCFQEQRVPDCPSNAFGFACTGTDTPNQDYPRMTCPTPAVAGPTSQGIPASLYCCTYTH